MASLHRQHGKPNWFCAFTDSAGVRHFRSTRTPNKKVAQEIANAWAKAAGHGKRGILNADNAREIIAHTVSDIYVIANSEDLPNSSIKAWCQQWLDAKSLEIAANSYDRYKKAIESFLEFFGVKADRNLAALQNQDIVKWRDKEAKRLSTASVNIMLKILRVCLGDAQRQGIISNNPAKLVRTIKQRGAAQRRNFTIAEIQKILEVARGEWRGIILFALYTGQRLGDIASLTWEQIDTTKNEVRLTTRKTGKRIFLPLTEPLRDYITELPARELPTAPLFPNAHEIYVKQGRVASLSNQFYDILVEAGLATHRSHQKAKDGQGRGGEREVAQISFHSLRHSTVTFLKAAGVSDALAQLIVGHESAAVSQNYTHLDIEDARKALAKLPNLNKGKAQS